MLPRADTAGNGESCSEPSSPEGNNVDADELIARGKRHIVCNDTAAAVECFQEACRLLAAKFGDFGDEVGEAYLHYGKALLDLSRCESDVIGAVVPGGEQNEGDDSDDSSDEGSEPKDNACDDGPDEPATSSETNFGNTDKTDTVTAADENIGVESTSGIHSSTADPSDERKAPTVGAAEEGGCCPTKKNSDEDALPASSASDNATEQEAKKSEDDNEGDKIPPLQLAWEVLEMAKVIFSRHDDKDHKLKAAEAHQLLGEVSLESEVYDQAIEDFQSCLQIQSEVLGSDDRELAASHYQLGMAYLMVQRINDAVNQFDTARTILQSRVQYLQQQLQGSGEPSQSNDPLKDKQRRELVEIESLLPEISAKIEDCEEERKLGSKVGMMIKESFASTSTGFGSASSDPEPCCSSSSSTPPVINNITSLVRKKKAEPEVSQVEVKRIKTEAENEIGTLNEASSSTIAASSESDTSLDGKARGAGACSETNVNAGSAINV